ncbi:type III pantothenate kinase [Ekhidna sp.]
MERKTEVILIDVGNSSIKTAEVSGGEFGKTIVWKDFLSIQNHYDMIIPFIISSVKNLDQSVFANRKVHFLSDESLLPISLDYHTPETLGADRIAAAVGAHDLFPDRNNLIVDLGTCMTIDLIDSSGIFQGGVISPGLQMRMKSLNHFTDQLPDISKEWLEINSSEIGKTTKECLLSGSFWAMMHEIKGVFRTLEKDFTSLNMLLTGGDAHFFESKLKAHIFAGSKIVHKGLYKIWKQQSNSNS